MKNIFENLVELLRKDERLVSEDGILLKNQIQELSRKNDKALIKLLLSDTAIKKLFFFEVDKTIVFDKEKFIRFISNKQFLPDSYTAFKNKIGLAVGDNYLSENKDTVLVWPYKDCVLEGGMTKEDQARDEIFYNETLAPDEVNRLLDPKVFANFKRIDKKGEHALDELRIDEKGNIKDNLIIKGNNLFAVASLKKRFSGKVKIIYIDPPYNIGNDSFRYNDKFNHSTWLTFMKNRLLLAKELLMNSGSIWISIDDRELHYLKILCDEIFGRENKISCITVKVKDPAGVGQQSPVFDVCEYLLVYAKNEAEFKNAYNKDFKDITPIDTKIDNYKHYILNYGKSKIVKSIERAGVGKVDIYKCSNYEIQSTKKLSFDDYIKSRKNIVADYNPSGGMILAIKDQIPNEGLSFIEYVPIRGKNKGQKTRVYFLNQRILSHLNEIIDVNENGIFKLSKLTNLWSIPNASLHLEGDVDFPNGKKPEIIFEKIYSFASLPNDLILDFHVGSGSSCAVAHKMNRQYIGIEQMEYEENSPKVRLKNVVNGDKTGVSKKVGWKGGGDFVYMELAEWNETWVEKIKKSKTAKDLMKIWNEMKGKAFLSYKVDPEVIDANAKAFNDLSIKDQKKFLMECLDKNHLYVNYSDIDDKDYGISKEVKALNNEFYKAK